MCRCLSKSPSPAGDNNPSSMARLLKTTWFAFAPKPIRLIIVAPDAIANTFLLVSVSETSLPAHNLDNAQRWRVSDTRETALSHLDNFCKIITVVRPHVPSAALPTITVAHSGRLVLPLVPTFLATIVIPKPGHASSSPI